jgi:DNA modification methylase
VNKSKAQPNQWRDRKIETVRMRVGDVLPHPMNPKIHPEGQLAPLRGLLETVGKLDDLKAYRSERAGGALVFFDGHGRQSLDPDAEWDVDIYDLSDAEADLAVATFDPIGWQAEQSRVKLDELLRDVSTGNAALMDLITKQAEEAGIVPPMASNPPGAGGDDFDTTPEETQTRVRYGDLWECGEHRVLCGDSSKEEDVDRLLQGERISLLATDPPYGVSYVAKARDLHARGYVHSHAARDLDIDSDELEGQALVDFLKACLNPALDRAADKCGIYVWHQDARRREFMAALDDLQIFIHQIVIWLKPGFVIGRCNYHHRFEPAFHGWPKGKRPDFLGERNQSNVWEVGRENDKVHPTQKPVEIFERPILNHTVKGDVVYEPFAGSGTQFIAAERASRKCYGLELEPKYVNVILSRWEAETGKQAKLLERVT